MNSSAVSKISFFLRCSLFFSFVALQADDYEQLSVIKRAHEDQLYLFVEEKASDFLQQQGLDMSRPWAQDAQYYLVAALVERGAFEEALLRCESWELTPKLTYLKARALYEQMVESGEPIASDQRRPSDLIQSVLNELEGPERVMAKYVMAKDFFDIGETTMSSALLLEIVEEHRSFRFYNEAMFLYGRSLYREDPPRIEKALEIFKALLDKFPNTQTSCRYAFWMAECYFVLNELDRAENYFKKALDLNADEDTVLDVHYNLGWLYVAMGRMEAAVDHLSRVVNSANAEAERYQETARYQLASIAMNQNRPKDVLTWLNPLLEKGLLKNEAALLSAQAWMTLSKWQRAKVSLESASQSLRDEIRLEAQRLLARVLLKLDDRVEAEAVLMKLINHEVPLDFHIDIQLQLAELYFSGGQIYAAQYIYLEVLKEKSRKHEPMLHYNLAKCTMSTNPLMECIYYRDQLMDQGLFLKEKERLEKRVRLVLSNMWIMASSKTAPYSKEEMLDILVESTKTDIEEERAAILDDYLEKDIERPSEIAMVSALYQRVVNNFLVELDYDGLIQRFDLSKAKLGVLSHNIEALQLSKILNHFNHIIDMAEKSPYLSLAHYEKFKLFRQRDLMADAFESLSFAIEHAADPKFKADYLMDMARTQIQVVKTIDGDSQTRNHKLKMALDCLDQLGEITPERLRSPDVIDLRFSAHQLLLNHDQAESLLLEYIFQLKSSAEARRFEEQLISFYQNTERPIQAAHRRLHLATQLDGVQAHRQKYKAALVFLENVSTQDEGIQILNELGDLSEINEWTLRAKLKVVEMAPRGGSLEKAHALMSSMMNQLSAMTPLMKLEVLLAKGHLLFALDQVDDAIGLFEQVREGAQSFASLRAQASLALGKALKKRDPDKSALIYLDFFYRFPDHRKAQEALYESCRLKAMSIQGLTIALRQQRITELKRLLTKIDSERERQSLVTYLEGLDH